MKLDPITKLMVTSQEFDNGEKLNIIHDLEFDGSKKSYMGYFNRWFNSTREWTEQSFIRYVKSRNPHCIFLSKKDYDKITEGQRVSATKEEWEAQETGKQ